MKRFLAIIACMAIMGAGSGCITLSERLLGKNAVVEGVFDVAPGWFDGDWQITVTNVIDAGSSDLKEGDVVILTDLPLPEPEIGSTVKATVEFDKGWSMISWE